MQQPPVSPAAEQASPPRPTLAQASKPPGKAPKTAGKASKKASKPRQRASITVEQRKALLAYREGHPSANSKQVAEWFNKAFAKELPKAVEATTIRKLVSKKGQAKVAAIPLTANPAAQRQKAVAFPHLEAVLHIWMQQVSLRTACCQ